jgi:hypothetical protein
MEQYMWKTPIKESGSVRDSDELPESERRTNRHSWPYLFPCAHCPVKEGLAAVVQALHTPFDNVMHHSKYIFSFPFCLRNPVATTLTDEHSINTEMYM